MAEHNITNNVNPEGANTLISRKEFNKPTNVAKPEVSSAQISPPKPKTWKDKFRESFVGNDVQSVGDYLIFSVLVPAIKGTLLSMINTGASMFLGAGPQQQVSQRSNNSYVRYNYVTHGPSGYNTTSINNNSPAYSGLKNISWGSEVEALDVLSDLRDYIFQLNQVSVAKYYTLARIPGFHPNYQDDKWGWYNLDSANVIPSYSEAGRWIIDLPNPIYLR